MVARMVNSILMSIFQQWGILLDVVLAEAILASLEASLAAEAGLGVAKVSLRVTAGSSNNGAVSLGKAAVAKDIIAVQNLAKNDLGDVLDKPPEDAVEPNPEGHKLAVDVTLATGKAKSLDVVHGATGPSGSDNRGNRQREKSANEEDKGGTVGPEEVSTGTGREQGEEIADGHLEVDHGDNLALLRAGKLDLLKEALAFSAVLVIGIQGKPEEQKGGNERNEGEHSGDGKDDAEVPALRAVRGADVIVANSHKGTVVEEGDQHEHKHGKVEELEIGIGDAIVASR